MTMHAPSSHPLPLQSLRPLASLDAAIGRGVGFLRRRLDPDACLWRDFVEPDGSRGSNVWVSAFVAAHLGRVPEARPMAAAVASGLTAHPRPSGGWGYDQTLLEDADSTAWVLLAVRHSGIDIDRKTLVLALRFLLRHQEPGGGFVTYGPRGVENFGHIAERAGWFTAQPCVSASALLALQAFTNPTLPAIDRTARYLLDCIQPDSLWHPYWWHGFTYATYHVVEALSCTDRLTPAMGRAVTRAVLDARTDDGGWSGRDPDRSTPFATALAVLTLCTLARRSEWGTTTEQRAAIQCASERLWSWQQADGGFPPSAELLVPGGSKARTLTMIDRGVFTTSCVLHALDRARALLGGRE